MIPDSWTMYRPLILAILDRAAKDAEKAGRLGIEAREWLLCEGMDWAEIAGVAIWPRRITNYERKSDTETA